MGQSAEMTLAKCPLKTACELVSLIGSHMLPGQHCQPTLTLSSQGCLNACLGVTCYLHFWHNDWGPYRGGMDTE